ncbi:MAG: TVP38/TMEM64 family protein [Myxococcales bacterium]|nr:MAG: TVP38/TMEM64 family protein [Myxococcales bacterium]
MDRGSLLKIGAAAAVAALFAWVYVSGAYEQFDPATMRDWIRAAGPWGGLLFVASYSVFQPFGVNGLVFLLSAPLIWNPTEAFLLNWAGTAGTGLFSYAGARFMARDWIQERLPRRVRRFDERLRTHGFRTVLLLRLIFYTTPSVQWALGVSQVRFFPFLVASVLGVAPFTLGTTLVGIRVAAWIEEHPVATWPWDQIWPVIIAATVVIVALGVIVLRKWRRTAVE